MDFAFKTMDFVLKTMDLRTKAGRTALECCDKKNGRSALNGLARPKSVAILLLKSRPFMVEAEGKRKRDEEAYRARRAQEAEEARVLLSGKQQQASEMLQVCIQIDEFCIQNVEFCTKDEDFVFKMMSSFIKNDELCYSGRPQKTRRQRR